MDDVINLINEKIDPLLGEFREVIEKRKNKEVGPELNEKTVNLYWKLGKAMVEIEEEVKKTNNGNNNILGNVSKKLTNDLGKGFSASYLGRIRKFYRCYPDFETEAHKLPWCYYFQLIKINEKDKRDSLANQARNLKWTERQLRKQVRIKLKEEQEALEEARKNIEKDSFVAKFFKYKRKRYNDNIFK